MSSSNAFSLRPLQPPNDRKPKNLAEFIARVNARPGGFRGLRQADLQRQIEENRQKQDAGDHGDVAMEDDGGSDDETDADATKDLTAARNEVIRNIEIAYFNAKQTLDFVSLWMSKERPTQVMGTLDGQLRQLVGIGTIGSTKLHEPTQLEQRQQDNAIIATGSKLLAINKSTGSLRAAATRLQKEATLENKYWQDVLDVSDRGWTVARLPSDRHTTAVKFGFSESAVPEFQTNSWAALRRAPDGSVALDTGSLASEPKRVAVRLEKGGKVFGRSLLPRATSDDAPIEERVREARNTILARELWHEMNREARTLLAYNVRMPPDSVVCSLDDRTTITFSLVTLEDEPEAGAGSEDPESHTGDAYAETICVGLHLLLTYAHRQNMQKRSQLLPLSIADQTSAAKPPYHLIKPVINYLQHELGLRATIQFLSNLTALLREAGIKEAGYTLQEHALPFVAAATASQDLLTHILSRLGFRVELTITAEARLEIIGVGNSVLTSQLTSGFFRIALLPPAARAQQQGSNNSQPSPPPPDPAASHPLSYLYPPADQYPTARDAFRYLSAATVRALAHRHATLAAEWTDQAPQHDQAHPPATWVTSLSGDGVRDRETERRGLRFELVSTPDGAPSSAPAALRTATPLPSELRVEAHQLENDEEGKPVRRSWSWRVGKPGPELVEVVRHVLMGTELPGGS